MKKLLGAVLALAMLYWCPIASADLLKNFKANGGIDVQADSVNNLTDLFNGNQTVNLDGAGGNDNTNDQIGQAATRLWVGASMDPTDDVHAKVTIYKNNRGFGNAEEDLSDGAGGLQDNLQVGEANVKVDLKDTCHVTLGRQFYGNAGDLVIYFGPSMSANWILPVTAVDAFRADHSGDWVTFTGIVGKLGGQGAYPITGGIGGAGAIVAGDVDIRGLDIGWKLPVEGLSVNTYGYNRVTHQAQATAGLTVPNDYLNNIGVKAKWTGGGLSLGTNIVIDNGQNRIDNGDGDFSDAGERLGNYRGFAHIWDASYKHEMMGTWNFGAQYAWGSGDDAGATGLPSPHNEGFQAVFTDFRPGAIWGRFPGTLGDALPDALVDGDGVNAAGLNDRVIWNIGVDYNPEEWEKLTAGIRYYTFARQRQLLDPDGAGPLASPGKTFGSEIDLDLGYKHSDNVWAGVGVARFTPGKAFTDPGSGFAPAGGYNQVTLFHADFKVMF